MSDGRYPAFPVVAGQAVYAHGMTLRDWFAGQAMQSAISNKDLQKAAAKDAIEMGDTIYDQVAWHSYRYADAMLEARDK